MTFRSYFRIDPLGRWCCLPWVGVALMLGIVLTATAVQGQVVVNGAVLLNGAATEATPAAGDDDDNGASLAFTLPLVDRKVSEAYDDFRRLCERKAWEKAFGQIGKLGDGDLESMIGSREGLFIPLRQRVWQDLAALDVEGARAYRLFNDAQAKHLLEDAEAAHKAGDAREAKILRKVYDFYFITAAGDKAADRMGDLSFEAGRFGEAARYWAVILDNRSDSEIPAVKLHVKRAVALARSGQWGEYQRTLKIVKDRYAGQTVNVAGKPVDAAGYLAEFGKAMPVKAEAQASSGTAAATAITQKVKLPVSDKPVWQMQMVSPSLQKVMAEIQPQWDGRGNVSGIVPVAIADKDRVYANWMGLVFALDIQTGKLIWQTDRFSQISKMIRELAYRFDVKRCSIMQVGDKLLTTGSRLNQLDRSRPSRLSCLEAATGKTVWSSESTLGAMSFAGKPTIVDGTIYAITRSQEKQNWNLTAIGFEDGKLLWSIPIGTPASGGQGFDGEPVTVDPVVAVDDGMVYVQTNCGVLLAISLAERRLLWAVSLDAPGPDAQSRRNRMMARYAMQMIGPPGTLLIDRGTAYVKDGQGDSLYAIDLGKPGVMWRRPLGSDESVIGLDAESLYTGGRDLGAIDRQTRKLKWSNPISTGAGPGRVMITGDSLLVFGPRGVFELDNVHGDVQQTFRGVDLESIGGVVLQVGERLITVSNLSVTAYGGAAGPERAPLAPPDSPPLPLPPDRATPRK